MSHLPLDARAILHYLNELGYRDISAEQLKEFLKDLRRLMKYEERYGSANKKKEKVSKEKCDIPKITKSILKNADKNVYQQYYFNVKSDLNESEAATSLLSSIPASPHSVKKEDVEKLLRNLDKEHTQRLIDLEKKMRSITVLIAGQDAFYKEFNKQNKENQQVPTKVAGTPMSSNRSYNKTQSPSCTKKSAVSESITTSAKQTDFTGQISPLSPEKTYKVPRRKQYIKANDPVQLHQYYQQEWANFGSRIPGNKTNLTCSKASLRNKLVHP